MSVKEVDTGKIIHDETLNNIAVMSDLKNNKNGLIRFDFLTACFISTSIFHYLTEVSFYFSFTNIVCQFIYTSSTCPNFTFPILPLNVSYSSPFLIPIPSLYPAPHSFIPLLPPLSLQRLLQIPSLLSLIFSSFLLCSSVPQLPPTLIAPIFPLFLCPSHVPLTLIAPIFPLFLPRPSHPHLNSSYFLSFPPSIPEQFNSSICWQSFRISPYKTIQGILNKSSKYFL